METKIHPVKLSIHLKIVVNTLTVSKVKTVNTLTTFLLIYLAGRNNICQFIHNFLKTVNTFTIQDFAEIIQFLNLLIYLQN